MIINGYDYKIKIIGKGQPTWVFLHGFLGSQDDFANIVPRGTKIYITAYGFAEKDQTLPAANFTVEHQVQDLITLLANLHVNSINLVGYSMGARLALSFSMKHPELIKQLFLESGTAGIANLNERKKRQLADQKRANQIEKNGLAAFVNHWEKLPLFLSQQQTDRASQQFMHQQRVQHNAVNMANSLRFFGTGVMPSWWQQLNQLKVPITLITGEKDVKFTTLNQKMEDLISNVKHITVENAGHNVHFERPQTFTNLLNQETNHEN